MIQGLELESAEKQEKYRNIALEEKYKRFGIKEGEEITWTGLFKYVEVGYDKWGDPIIKRKRVFKKTTKETRYLSQEQNEEIKQCFCLFDKDGSGSINLKELKDAMKALGVFLKKDEVQAYMQKVDKDGSGSLELTEFICLMTEVLSRRDAREEMRKVFRCYDNDDDGNINSVNLWQCAEVLEMMEQVNEINIAKMIEIGDKKKNGYVDQEDFMILMKELGLIPEKEEGEGCENDLERAYEDAKE